MKYQDQPKRAEPFCHISKDSVYSAVDNLILYPLSHSSVRVSVYRTLELWVQVAGASASILQGSPSHSELLFSHLLSDITPGAESIKVSPCKQYAVKRWDIVVCEPVVNFGFKYLLNIDHLNIC